MSVPRLSITLLVVAMVLASSAGCVSQTRISATSSQTPDHNGSIPEDLSSTPANLSGLPQIVGNFTFLTLVPDSPASIPEYRGILRPEDQIDYEVDGLLHSRNSVISKDEALNATTKAMEKYGGIPSDAIFEGIDYTVEKTYDNSLEKFIDEKPIIISVQFIRKIDGKSIVGVSDIINLDFGDTKEPSSIYKRWRTIEPTGHNIPVISVGEALGRLERFETMVKGQSMPYSYSETDYFPNATIRNMTLGFYEGSDKEIIFQPVWIIEGNYANGKKFYNYVYALQFANFTTTQDSLNVQFTDSSDASPVRWYWDFGDGANTTVQNPVHTYEDAGTYNVTLTAWNDLGSDSVTKPVRAIA